MVLGEIVCLPFAREALDLDLIAAAAKLHGLRAVGAGDQARGERIGPGDGLAVFGEGEDDAKRVLLAVGIGLEALEDGFPVADGAERLAQVPIFDDDLRLRGCRGHRQARPGCHEPDEDEPNQHHRDLRT